MKKQKKTDNLISYEKEYQLLQKKGHINKNLEIKTVKWQNGENFEIFSLFKNVYSGTTSTDSLLLTNSDSNA